MSNESNEWKAVYDKFAKSIKRLDRAMTIEIDYECLGFPYEWIIRDLEETRELLVKPDPKDIKGNLEYEAALELLDDLMPSWEEYNVNLFREKLEKVAEKL